MYRTAFLLSMIFILAQTSTISGADLYVSPQGDDGNPGSLEKPLKTLPRAQEAARALLRSHAKTLPVQGITVWLRGGRYELSQPFVLGLEDSGREGAPTVYRAYPNECPVLSGGYVIRKWEKCQTPPVGLPATAMGKVWVASVPEAKDGKWPFRQLWRNGKRLTRARWPNLNECNFQVVDVSLPTAEALKPGPVQDRWRESFIQSWRTARFRAEDLKQFPNGKLPNDLGDRNAEVFTLLGGQWATMRIPIAKVDGVQLSTAVPMGCLSYYWGGMHLMPGRNSGVGTGHIENALSLLDTTGEWYLDAKAGLVYYLAAEGEDPNATEFIAPKLESLVCLTGTPEKAIRWVELRGLRFEHAEWRMPDFGYRPVLYCHYGTQLSPLPALVVPCNEGSIRTKDEHPEFCLPAAIDLSYAHHCVMELCRLGHTGASGIGLAEGCRHNRIVGCKVFDTGGHGIHAGSAHGPFCGEDFSRKRKEDEPLANEISNCYVHHVGQMDWGAGGIVSFYSHKNRIAHNLVEHVPYGGIAGCMTWFAMRPGRQEEVTIEYNHIRHVAKKLTDTAGIYMEGVGSPKSALSVIRGNLIHDIARDPWGQNRSNGIFLDDCSWGVRLEDNIVYGTVDIPVRFNLCSKGDFSWGTNYFGVKDYPRELAAKAGPREPYRSQLLGKTQD